jgi:hypothetical protein
MNEQAPTFTFENYSADPIAALNIVRERAAFLRVHRAKGSSTHTLDKELENISLGILLSWKSGYSHLDDYLVGMLASFLVAQATLDIELVTDADTNADTNAETYAQSVSRNLQNILTDLGDLVETGSLHPSDRENNPEYAETVRAKLRSVASLGRIFMGDNVLSQRLQEIADR